MGARISGDARSRTSYPSFSAPFGSFVSYVVSFSFSFSLFSFLFFSLSFFLSSSFSLTVASYATISSHQQNISQQLVLHRAGKLAEFISFRFPVHASSAILLFLDDTLFLPSQNPILRGLEDKIGFLACLGSAFPRLFDSAFGTVLERVEVFASMSSSSDHFSPLCYLANSSHQIRLLLFRHLPTITLVLSSRSSSLKDYTISPRHHTCLAYLPFYTPFQAILHRRWKQTMASPCIL